MSDLGARRKREGCNLTDNEGSSKARIVTSSVADPDKETRCPSEKVWDLADQDDEIHYLSGKFPFFDVVMSKSYVDPANLLRLPMSVIPMLPRGMVITVLRHGGKEWEVYYTEDNGRPRFGSNWKKFVVDNCLKMGDACVFELINPGHQKPVFNVRILRDDIPPELQTLIDTRGKMACAPIVLD